LLAIKGIGTRDQAQALIGADILIERTRLPELEDDAYYWSDLIGLSVFSEQGEFLGKVTTIMRTGSNDVYVVQDRSDGKTRETLVPALKWVVVEVNLEQGTMHVNLPEGL
jgi:16S rRNA processing protein RimM